MESKKVNNEVIVDEVEEFIEKTLTNLEKEYADEYTQIIKDVAEEIREIIQDKKHLVVDLRKKYTTKRNEEIKKLPKPCQYEILDENEHCIDEFIKPPDETLAFKSLAEDTNVYIQHGKKEFRKRCFKDI